MATNAPAQETTNQDSQAAQQQQEPVSCPILHLDLGPLHLDLLGLVIDLNEVVLDITAVPGALLGNLLCALSNLLSSVLGNLLNSLSNVLGNLLRKLIGGILGRLGLGEGAQQEEPQPAAA